MAQLQSVKIKSNHIIIEGLRLKYKNNNIIYDYILYCIKNNTTLKQIYKNTKIEIIENDINYRRTRIAIPNERFRVTLCNIINYNQPYYYNMKIKAYYELTRFIQLDLKFIFAKDSKKTILNVLNYYGNEGIYFHDLLNIILTLNIYHKLIKWNKLCITKDFIIFNIKKNLSCLLNRLINKDYIIKIHGKYIRKHFNFNNGCKIKDKNVILVISYYFRVEFTEAPVVIQQIVQKQIGDFIKLSQKK